MIKGYIYKYTFPNGKVYIGQTRRDIEVRIEEHIHPVQGKTNPALWAAYQEFGEYEFEIIKTIQEKDIIDLKARLDYLELYYINKYKSNDPLYGYNKTIGNLFTTNRYFKEQETLRYLLNEEYKQKYEQYNKLYLSVFEKLLKPVEQFNDDEILFLKDYFRFNKHARKALKDFNIKHIEFNTPRLCDKFRQVLNEKIQDYIDYKYKELEEYYFENKDDIIKRCKEDYNVIRINMDGICDQIYESIYEVEAEYGTKKMPNIKKCLKGERKTAYGYKWSLKKDYNPEL